MYPACATDEYASMRFSDDCPSAPTLPTMIVIVANAARAGPHVDCASMSAVSKKRRNTPSAATFVATAMNAVTGVGAPSYTSGVHW